MYLKHFGLKKNPFTLTPNTEFGCNFSGHQEALNVLLYGLHSGEGIIKIIGEVGSGKTFLCRELLNYLDKLFTVIYIPNPDLTSQELKNAIARELKCDNASDGDAVNHIFNKLFSARKKGKKVVAIIDEAQALTNESLETLRLLTNLETESEKLLQIVLFAQPELNERLKKYEFRQLNQRIAFSYTLIPLNCEEVEEYISQRLVKAGHKNGRLFERDAIQVLYRASGGIPRIINILCHKALLASYGKGNKKVGRDVVKMAIKDSSGAVAWNYRRSHLCFAKRLFGFAV